MAEASSLLERGFTISEKFYMYLLGVGYLLISISLITSFFVWIGSVHLIVMLEINPQRYLRVVWNNIVYYVGPLSVGLSLLIVGFIKTKKERQRLRRTPLLLFGIVFLGWGLLRVAGGINSYDLSRSLALQSSMKEVLLGPVTFVHLTRILGHVLLVVSGIITLGVECSTYLKKGAYRELAPRLYATTIKSRTLIVPSSLTSSGMSPGGPFHPI